MMEQVLLYLALAAGFYMAWNIGANDVANAFGTAVGSGALTFRQALLIAAIFEFSGTFFLGSHVTATISGNIVVPEIFIASPRLFAMGMLAALLGAAAWLHIATFFSKPVSTTHAIIGSVVGFGITAAGPGCVQWMKLLRIAASWIISPLAGLILGFIVYLCIQKFVLRSRDPAARAQAAVPLAFSAVILIIAFSITYNLMPRLFPVHSTTLLYGVGLPLAASVFLALLGATAAYLYLRGHARAPGADHAAAQATVESWFARMQIMTASYMSFAHGANDVANAIAPIAGIVHALRSDFTIHAPVPSWLLAFGGAGIVIGLVMYGRKVIETVGRRITEVTPTRGFSAEISTASTVLACSLMGLPISTTFVLVGAIMGVGFARGFGAIDLSVVKNIFVSWIITIPAAAGLAMVFYWILSMIWR